MEVIAPDWIERMVMYSAHPGIGAVGGRLIVEDGRLQHVGVLFENGGFPGHPYHGFSREFGGYSNSVLVAQNLLAVTGACLMTPRDGVRGGRRPQHRRSRSTTTTSTTA